MQMEKLKEPEMFLGVANSAGLIAVVAYFYKQMELTRQQLKIVEVFCAGAHKKLEALEKSTREKTEIMKDIRNELNSIGDQVSTIENDVIPDVEEIINTLEVEGIKVDRQLYAPPQRQKKQPSRSIKSRDIDTDASTRSSRSSRQERPERNDRQERNERPTQRPTVRQRPDREQSDDDTELINVVRGEDTTR
jgi:hypothetical protein